MGRPEVFLDLTIWGKAYGRIVMELYNDIVPKMAEKKGEKGIGKSGKFLNFKGSPFYTMIPDFMNHSGDFMRSNGTGGEYIYGEKFNDKNFKERHTGSSVLSMTNAGPNGSQFFLYE